HVVALVEGGAVAPRGARGVDGPGGVDDDLGAPPADAVTPAAERMVEAVLDASDALAGAHIWPDAQLGLEQLAALAAERFRVGSGLAVDETAAGDVRSDVGHARRPAATAWTGRHVEQRRPGARPTELSVEQPRRSRQLGGNDRGRVGKLVARNALVQLHADVEGARPSGQGVDERRPPAGDPPNAFGAENRPAVPL